MKHISVCIEEWLEQFTPNQLKQIKKGYAKTKKENKKNHNQKKAR
jgi:hypothetical protein